ncbi:MAG: hypothetical protein WCE68_12965 [Anaerolineales bacterium]
MKNRFEALAGKVLLILSLGMLFLAGCGPRPAAPAQVRVAGACDVLSLTGAACDPLPMLAFVEKGIQQGTGLALTRLSSTDSLADLRAGRADVALLGREPSAADLQGLQDHVIAYDAVCIMLSSRVYSGALQQGELTGGILQPMFKYNGLQDLSWEELRGFYSNLLQKNMTWQLQGPQAALLTFQDYTDDNGVSLTDPNNPNVFIGQWVWTQVQLSGEMLPPGKFDTQAVLLHDLGFQESDLARPGISFVPALFDSEAELVSSRFSVDPLDGQKVSSLGLNFFLLIASRQVTELAIQHGFQVRAVSIAGIDPLGDPHFIYTGLYPLSRRIHLVTRASASPAAQALLRYLLSPAGQALIAKAGYLPLPKP